MRVGGAAVSEKHCNFIINDDNASPEDIEILGEKIIQKVHDAFRIKLEWEIVRLGKSTGSMN
jgi:UDP-N-acetylmuramate dehydrogenase